MSRYAEAETCFRHAIAISEKTLGSNHPNVALTLANLAAVLHDDRRFEEGLSVIRRSLSIDEASYGPNSPKIAEDLRILTALLRDTGRLDEAEASARRALKIDEASNSQNRVALAKDLSLLALTLQRAKKLTEAERTMQQALAASEQALGADHPEVGIVLNNYGILLIELGNPAGAEALYRRAVSIAENTLGSGHPQVALPLNNLAWLKAKQGDWKNALVFIRRATEIRAASANRMAGGSVESQRRLQRYAATNFRGHVLMAYRAGSTDAALRDEAFIVAQQLPDSQASLALSQASARFASGQGPLAALIRRQQDLTGEREAVDRRLIAALSKSDRTASDAARDDEARLDAQLASIAAKLSADFPEYSGLISPKPLSIAQVQALLADQEALVLYVDSPEYGEPYHIPETAFIWVITRREARWIELPFGPVALKERVEKLRCGLDSSNWREGANSRQACKQLLGVEVSENDLPPFDAGASYALYRDLFGAAEDLIKDKSLLFVPSGALTQLPLAALVTGKPDDRLPRFEAYRNASWLGQRQPITALPSVANLKAMHAAKKSAAAEPFIGFGNPLLTGPNRNDRSAWAIQTCQAFAEHEGSLAPKPWGLANPFPDMFRSGSVITEALRRQPPLPDTADELCTVARLTGASPESVYLGAQATVSRVASLSAQGTLSKKRIVHFATHGLVAGETGELTGADKAEPALLLTQCGRRR